MNRQAQLLIIDDSPTQAQSYANHLEAAGVHIMVATDGPQGLRMAESIQPDAILLDVRLPNMDGHQVCHRLKRNPKTQHIPVIMFTVSDNMADQDAGYEAGADAYIRKDRDAIQQILSKLAEYGFIAAR
ncbi:MAG: hypothetical protein Kow00117_06650 [Phototrophicales bacterium]